MKAVWNGVPVAESDDTLVVENNRCFPSDSIHAEYFVDSPTTSICAWKGRASYKSLNVGGESNPDAAWYYPEPKDADYDGRDAGEFAGRYAFWNGVTVEP
jgi:uncharacterized protein (DUF427 family)